MWSLCVARTLVARGQTQAAASGGGYRAWRTVRCAMALPWKGQGVHHEGLGVSGSGVWLRWTLHVFEGESFRTIQRSSWL